MQGEKQSNPTPWRAKVTFKDSCRALTSPNRMRAGLYTGNPAGSGDGRLEEQEERRWWGGRRQKGGRRRQKGGKEMEGGKQQHNEVEGRVVAGLTSLWGQS